MDTRADRIAHVAFFALMFCSILAPTINVAIASLSGSHSDGMTGEGSPIRMVLYLFVFGLTLYSVAIAGRPRSWWPLPAGLTITLLWFTISILWALNPAVGIRRLILTVAITWSVLTLVQRIGYRSTVATLRFILPLVLMCSYIAVLLFPSYGITDDAAFGSAAGSWRGILSDKNYAGPVCALTIFLFALDGRELHRLYRIGVVIAAAYFLYQTRSKTSLGLAVISLCLAFAFRRYNPYYRLVLGVLIATVAAMIGAVVFGYRDSIIQAGAAYFEDPDSLTGRVQIWPLLWEFAQHNLLLGSGFGSFWNIGSASPIFAENDGWIAEIASGHNGYLDLLAQVGLPGLLLSLMSAVAIPLSQFLTNGALNRERGALLIAFFVFIVGQNFTESNLFDRDSVLFVFLLIVIASLKSAQSDQSNFSVAATTPDELQRT